MTELDAKRVGDYFAKPDTVSEWWTPDSGPLAFHYDADDNLVLRRDDDAGSPHGWARAAGSSVRTPAT